MKVIIINGYPQAGKDTFIEYCSECTSISNFSTVDKVKEALVTLGWEGEKTPEIRKALSDIKDLSTKLFDGPVRYIKGEISNIENRVAFGKTIPLIYPITPPALVFIHSREPEEIQRFKEELNALTLLISRTPAERLTNHADQNVEKYDYDVVIDNNGTLDDLRKAAQDFVRGVKGYE